MTLPASPSRRDPARARADHHVRAESPWSGAVRRGETIRIVDLGFLVPICLGVAVGLWRGSVLAVKAAYGVVAFLTLQAAAVLAMGGVMIWRDDPAASAGFAYALTPITLALAACSVALLRSYAGSSLASPPSHVATANPA